MSAASLPAPPTPRRPGPRVAIKHAVIGWGRLAQALVPALRAAGQAVAVGRRAPGPGELNAGEAAAGAQWVWLTVPDDHIAATAAALPWAPGQLALHCSGAMPLSVLSPAPAAAGFHPLRLMAADSGAAWEGFRVAIEADAAHRATLQTLATQLGLVPLMLPCPMSAEARAAYHAAANLAASGVLAVLAQAQALWGLAGLAPRTALGALLPLSRGALATVEARGLADAVSGPVARGDVGVVHRHLAAAAALPQGDGLMRALAHLQLELLSPTGRLTPRQMQAMQRELDA